MTTQRRGRNGYTGRRWRQHRKRSQSASDEASSDGESVTRCVCGETHNVGLMVQCDKCEVWQHCECVGLEEQDIPEQYFCEECRPNDYLIHKAPPSKTRRTQGSNALASADKKPPKKRTTLNSREASMSLEDVLAARTALERVTSYQSNGSSAQVVDGLQDGKLTKRRKGSFGESAPEDKSQASSSAVSSIGKEDALDLSRAEDGTPGSDEDLRPVKPRRSANRLKAEEPNERQKRTRVTQRRAGTPGTNKRTPVAKPRSRTSTPQPSDAASQCTSDNGAVLFERFSAHARDLSPPARVRYPSGRMTIPEMTRRAKQILEYISSIQIEMSNNKPEGCATKSKSKGLDQEPSTNGGWSGTSNVQVMTPLPTDLTLRIDDEVTSGHVPALGVGEKDWNERKQTSQSVIPLTIPRDENRAESPSSVLSSASTIPLDDTQPASPRCDFDDDEKGTAEEALSAMARRKPSHELSSLELMDMLTRELIKFQRRFGSSTLDRKPSQQKPEDHEKRVIHTRGLSTARGEMR